METPLTQYIKPGQPPMTFREYEQTGGYAGVRRALKQMTPEEVIAEVKKARLMGRGGAGFPAGVKWGFMPQKSDAAPLHYLICNADEMEPGTFKDRYLLEGNPHQILAGIIVAAYAIQAEVAYVFIRWAYKQSARAVRKALAEAYAAGFLGKNILGSGFNLDVYVHTSAGRYICGEETALLSSLEGKRGLPRAKPPFPPASGLFGKPSNVNNVETLSWPAHIIEKGADWFLGLSHSDEGGTKLYGVSGHVRKPGLWELPMGTTVRELLMEHAGGMDEGYSFRGALPGGASTDFITADHLDTRMDFKSLTTVGSRLGTGTMIILDDRTCPVAFIHNLVRFFATESCGWCTPCREGLPWVEKILLSLEQGKGQPGDLDILQFHTWYCGPGNTFCAHAPGAMEPLQSGLKYFREDFERHIKEKRCPWRKP
jgi:NADH-quinone oxidoreductase subunit F